MNPLFEQLKSWLGFGPLTDSQFERQRDELLGKIPVPVFWLFGKTGSGKTSIIRFLTGSTQAEIGNGFQPQTKTSFEYDFPSADTPLVRFLDTRGLGEAGYNPSDDLKAFGDSTHVVIVVARVMDHALAEIVTPLKLIRASKPSRPIVLALTCLHEAYPFQQHPNPDPFEQAFVWPDVGQTTDTNGHSVPAAGTATRIHPASTHPISSYATHSELQRSLQEQEERFAGLADCIVPIDFTRPEEGFDEPNYGGRRLEETLIQQLPAACRQALLHLDELRSSLLDLTARQALPTIITYSSLAAGAAAAPLPWIDIPVVIGIQSRLVYLLADLYDQKMNADLLVKMAGAIGGRLAVRFAVRAPLKLVPIIGQSANAAMAFAYTFSLGKACCWYFGEQRNGHIPSVDELDRVWAEQLQKAVQVWRTHPRGAK